MKKLLTSLIAIMVLTFGTAIVQPQQISQANAYERNLNGDPNYLLLSAHMGSAIYLDISSIVVKVNIPHQDYIWAQNEVFVDTDNNNTITKIRTEWYGWDKDMNSGDESECICFHSDTGNKGEWTRFNLYDNSGPQVGLDEAFRRGFRQAFGFTFS